jgi:hypothetical protein
MKVVQEVKLHWLDMVSNGALKRGKRLGVCSRGQSDDGNARWSTTCGHTGVEALAIGYIAVDEHTGANWCWAIHLRSSCESIVGAHKHMDTAGSSSAGFLVLQYYGGELIVSEVSMQRQAAAVEGGQVRVDTRCDVVELLAPPAAEGGMQAPAGAVLKRM